MTDREFHGLVNGIRTLGFNQRIVVSYRTAEQRYTLIDGNHRTAAVELLGHTEVAAEVYTDLSEAEIRAMRLGLNKWRGQIKHEIERQDLRFLHEAGWQQDVLSDLSGFSPPDLEAILESDPPIQEILPDLPDIPEPGDGDDLGPVARSGALEIKIACSSEEAREELLALLKRAAKAGGGRGKWKLEAALRWALQVALQKD